MSSAEPGAEQDADPNDVVLHGERLTLRRAVAEDGDALALILSEPEVVRWWGPYDPETALDELDISFVILVGESVVGWLLFDEEEWWQYPQVAFDIALTAALHGRGYGQEALRIAIRHFIARGHHRFQIDPAADNERAIRTYQALGFKPIGILRQYERRDEAWHDGLLMDLLADEFVDG